MTISLLIQFQVKPEKQVSFTALLETLKTELPNVNGCTGVVIYQNITASCHYTLTETWESLAQHKQHIDTIIATGVWDNMQEHLSQSPTSQYYRII